MRLSLQDQDNAFSADKATRVPTSFFSNQTCIDSVCCYLGKTAPENPPIPLNSLFPEDSVYTDSNEDLAEEFFRCMIWSDLSGEEEEEESSFIEDEEREGSISAADLFAEFDDFDDRCL